MGLRKVGKFARGTMVILLALVIWGGPAYRQLFDGPEPWALKWMMFSGIGMGMLGVHFEAETPSGVRRTIVWDQFQPPRAPDARFQVARARELHQVARRAAEICQGLGSGTKLHVSVRRATQEGWKVIGSPDWDLCDRTSRSKFERQEAKPNLARRRSL